MRKALALGSAAVAVVALGTPAFAADTTATFTLTAGALSISVPSGTSEAPVDLGSTAAGASTLSKPLGAVKVTDSRGALVAAWTASVTSTAFVTGTLSSDAEKAAAQTVAPGAIAYSSGVGTPETGQLGAMVPGVLTSLASQGTAATWAGTGNNTVTWNPTLTFTLAKSQVAGTYKGTVTHSVA